MSLLEKEEQWQGQVCFKIHCKGAIAYDFIIVCNQIIFLKFFYLDIFCCTKPKVTGSDGSKIKDRRVTVLTFIYDAR